MKLNRKWKTLGTFACFSLTACSSMGGNNHLASTGAIELDRTQRDPASEPQVYWDKAEKSFEVGSSGIRESFSLDIHQVKQWTEMVPYQDTCYENRVVQEPAVCEGYHCNGGAGKSEAWNTFYNAPREQKDDALAAAIKGVGRATAQKLVNGGFFHSKPRSWDDFVAELRRATTSGAISEQNFYETTVKYKTENMLSLGYQSSSCTVYTYNCTQWEERLVSFSCTKQREQEFKRTIDTVTRPLQLEVRDGILQAFEQDTVHVSVGRDANDVNVEAGPYNHYNVNVRADDTVARISLSHAQRLRVDLPRAVVRTSKLDKANGALALGIKVDSKYIPHEGSDQLVLRYTIQTCKKTLGVCWGSFTSQQEVSIPVTQEELVIPVQITNKQRAKVVFSLARKNSRFYNDNFLGAFETDTRGL